VKDLSLVIEMEMKFKYTNDDNITTPKSPKGDFGEQRNRSCFGFFRSKKFPLGDLGV